MRITITCEKNELHENGGDGIDLEVELLLENDDQQLAILTGEEAYFFDRKEILRAVKALCEEDK